MTVTELIEMLKEMPKDAPVCVYADHGQYTMKATNIGMARISEDEYKKFMMETTHDEDVHDGEKYIMICEISAS